MSLNRIKALAVLVVVAFGLACNTASRGSTPQALPQESSSANRCAAVPPVPRTHKPLRVLIFAGGPSHEFQLVRRLFVREVACKRAELSICLQQSTENIAFDVPPERLLGDFPELLEQNARQPDNKYVNLLMYDVVIAFDTDWSQLSDAQQASLVKWLKEYGGGLVLVPGPLKTYKLSYQKRLKPLADLLPVELQDYRVAEKTSAGEPAKLAFTEAASNTAFLNLDGNADQPLRAWEEFFAAGRGFYKWYPVERIRDGAVELAHVAIAGKLPFLLTGQAGKGRVVFLAWGDTWRLLQYRPNWYDRFWDGLVRYAANARPTALESHGQAVVLSAEERRAVDKALDYLVKQQLRDGRWQSKVVPYPTSETALAGQALLMAGSTLQGGKYAAPVRRAVEYLLKNSQRNGLIGSPNANEANRYMLGHGHAMAFLASVYGDEEDADRRESLAKVLNNAIVFTEKSQSINGNWFCRSAVDGGGDRDPDSPETQRSTLVQLQALSAARTAGLPVPRQLFDNAHKYLAKHFKDIDPLKEADPFAPAVLAAGYTDQDWATPAAKKLLSFGRPALVPADKWTGGVNELSGVYFVQALLAYRLGDSRYAQLMPDSKADERITWSQYRKETFATLVKAQAEDGSWDDTLGNTALHLAILQLESAALPVYQR